MLSAASPPIFLKTDYPCTFAGHWNVDARHNSLSIADTAHTIVPQINPKQNLIGSTSSPILLKAHPFYSVDAEH